MINSKGSPLIPGEPGAGAGPLGEPPTDPGIIPPLTPGEVEDLNGLAPPPEEDKPLFEIDFPEFVIPDFAAMMEEQQRHNRIFADRALTDQLWSERQNAVNSVISEVDRRLSSETVRADLLGRDFEITEESRKQRINELFSEIWTESNENQLDTLVRKYGNPEQDIQTRGLIEVGLKDYDFEFDVIRALPEDAIKPRRDREKQVGDKVPQGLVPDNELGGL